MLRPYLTNELSGSCGMLAGKRAEKRPLGLRSTDIHSKLTSPLKYTRYIIADVNCCNSWQGPLRGFYRHIWLACCYEP